MTRPMQLMRLTLIAQLASLYCKILVPNGELDCNNTRQTVPKIVLNKIMCKCPEHKIASVSVPAVLINQKNSQSMLCFYTTVMSNPKQNIIFNELC